MGQVINILVLNCANYKAVFSYVFFISFVLNSNFFSLWLKRLSKKSDYSRIDRLRGVENVWLFFDDVIRGKYAKHKKIKLAKRMIGMQNID